MERTSEVRYCVFSAASPGPYAQYLLPHIASRARWNPEHFIALGATWKGYAAGAAAVSVTEEQPDTAVLVSLFVDPKARGQGIGTGLVRLAAEEAGKLGAETLEMAYIMSGPELEAMDKTIQKLGGELVSRNNVYTLDSAKFHDSPVFGWTLTPYFQPNANVRRFYDLSREQVERLNANAEIPIGLRPASKADLMDPALSVAWVEDGEIVSFLLTSYSRRGSYAALSGWRAASAPGDAYVHLLMACANLCYYHGGGDFLYHLAPITEHSEAMVHAYAGDCYVCMEEHAAELDLPLEIEDGEREDAE